MRDLNPEVLLALANVESAYGPIKAIRGVSLKVHKGEIATVLGSNGAGKSTILKTISGIIDPQRGTVAPAETQPMVAAESRSGVHRFPCFGSSGEEAGRGLRIERLASHSLFADQKIHRVALDQTPVQPGIRLRP